MLTLYMTRTFLKNGKHRTLRSRVNLVDLAGSEDVEKSGVTGAEFREAVQINTGLLQLQRVMESLEQRSKFIPYRDSTLTRILADSQGGTSRTYFFAHINSCEDHARETAATLRYATMARNIRNRPTARIHEITQEAEDPDLADPHPGLRFLKFTMLLSCEFLNLLLLSRLE